VGIGTITPTRARLEQHGALGATSAIFGGESSGISFQRNYPGIGFNQYYSTESRYMSNGYAAALVFDPNTGTMGLEMFGTGLANVATNLQTRAFTIRNDGNMGIKTGPANASLYVRKWTNFGGAAIFGGTTYNSHFSYSNTEDTYIRGGRNGGRLFINDISGGKISIGNGSGLVGINNGVPVYPLEIRQVNGRGIALVEPANNFNYWELRIARAGTTESSDMNYIYNGQYKGFFNNYTGNYLVYSDKRLKTGIAGMKAILDRFLQLEPVEYEMKYNNSTHEKTIGFIAQDVSILFPELVTITADSSRGQAGIRDLHGINYDGFTILTIKAIQEQQKQIEDMRELNRELARRIRMAEDIINEKK
jgi:hypothetical protein